MDRDPSFPGSAEARRQSLRQFSLDLMIFYPNRKVWPGKLRPINACCEIWSA